MRTGEWQGVGLAFGPSARRIAARHPDLVDYLELPFELFRSQPGMLDSVSTGRRLLHCASLSLAGSLPLDEATLADVEEWLDRTGSPWLSEHLAYVSAEAMNDGQKADCDHYYTGFTVPPPMNEEMIDHISRRIRSVSERLGTRILIENSPLYFDTPGSTLSQVDFINRILNCTDADLLLDLTHLTITGQNMGFSPADAICQLPAARIAQLHLSGIEVFDGVALDHHASAVPPGVLELVPLAMRGSQVAAITLEYNWISDLEDRAIISQLAEVRECASRCRTI